MSGIEVIGLVLGGFPLLLGALKKNREALEIFDDWYKVRKVYESCLSQVKAEHVLFDYNIRGFLEPILCDNAKLEELLANPYSGEWRSESLASEIKDFKYLPMAYESYIAIMQEFHNTMIALGKELGMDKASFQRKMMASNTNSDKRRDDLRETIESEWHRIRFNVNKKRRARLLTALTTCNEYLVRFSASSSGSQSPLRPSNTRKTAMPPSLLRFWQHARELYPLMQQAWCCNCCTSHNTDLLLRDLEEPHKIEFKFLFTFAEKLTTQHSGPWDWKEADITALERSPPHVVDAKKKSMMNAVKGTQVTTTPANQPASRSKKVKGVTFMDNVLPSVNVAALLPLEMNPPPPRITNLCTDLTTIGPHEVQLGALVNDSNTFAVSLSKQKPLTMSALEHVTLNEILRSKLNKTFTRRQRYTIALAIASSYVQLHASPWIWTGWDKQDIYLLYDPNKALFHEQPRISRRISTQPPPSHGQQDRSIVTLGIMLLELAFGQALGDNRFRQKRPSINGQPDPFVDKAAAEEWCLTCADDEHPHFAGPVMWCLNHSTARANMDLNSDIWRKDLFENVVQPLKDCCKENKFRVLDLYADQP